VWSNGGNLEAKKQFWNFDDNEEEQDEPLIFVIKPAEAPLPSSSMCHVDSDVEGFRLNDDDEYRVRIGTPPTITRKPRDEHPKDVVAWGSQTIRLLFTPPLLKMVSPQ
jgi:serine/threonine-protein kinase RIM15